MPITATCLLASWRRFCSYRTNWKCYTWSAFRNSRFTWGSFIDPGHFLSPGWDDTQNITGSKNPCAMAGEEGPDTIQLLHATSTYPLDVLHFESFSTLRESCYVFGGCWEGWCGHAQKQGSIPKSPWRISHLPCSSSSPARAS